MYSLQDTKPWRKTFSLKYCFANIKQLLLDFCLTLLMHDSYTAVYDFLWVLFSSGLLASIVSRKLNYGVWHCSG